MKNFNLKIFFALLLAFLVLKKVWAAPISLQEAKVVAKNFIIETSKLYYHHQIEGRSIILDVIQLEKNQEGEPYYYMFNIKPDGFIIVSAETAFNPILGYSFSGKLHTEMKNTAFESWMQYYKNYIDYIRSHKLSQTKKMGERWKHYNGKSIDDLGVITKDNIQPLLTNTWNQDYPYNYYCPEDEKGPGNHVYAGCVATAMSMIMYHYKYPQQGTGTHSYYAYPYGYLTVNYGETQYNWNAMTDEISTISNQETIFAIAQLQYHCGVSVNMSYSPEGSGSYSERVPGALDSYFGYPNAQHVMKSNYSSVQWNNLLTQQLENSYPVYYSGISDDGGHAFCLDGKQGDDMFHFNFGWSGYNNGFYYLDGEGAVGGYHDSQAAVIDFYPPEEAYPYDCSEEIINAGGGVINDYAFPNKPYTSNLDCRWLLVPESEKDSVQQFEFRFLSLNLGAGDYVTIYDGASENNEKIGEYTGNTIPEEVFSSTNDTVLIVFKTNENESENDGFRLSYKAKHPKYCIGATNYTAIQGVITDGSGDFNYPNESNICQYRITPQDAKKVTLTFEKFDLAEGDEVVIFQTNPTQQIAALNHYSNPTSFVSNTGSMLIAFKTDNFFNAGGFEASYKSENINVEPTERYSKLELYPNPTSNRMTLNMRIKGEKTLTVSIHHMDGKIIVKDLLHNMAGTFYKEFDVCNLVPGMYLIVIETSQEKITRRFIVR